MGMPRNLRSLWASNDAAAAAEMALVVPLLVTLMFGSFEIGKYFLDEHVVVKAVRDGARYAARQGFSEYTCPGATVSGPAVTRTQNIVRFGMLNPTVSDAPRLPYWQATSDGQPSVQVTVTCQTSLDGAGVEPHGGIYAGKANVPVVTVAAIVEYESLFGLFGYGGGLRNVRAESQSAVMGI